MDKANLCRGHVVATQPGRHDCVKFDTAVILGNRAQTTGNNTRYDALFFKRQAPQAKMLARIYADEIECVTAAYYQESRIQAMLDGLIKGDGNGETDQPNRTAEASSAP